MLIIINKKSLFTFAIAIVLIVLVIALGTFLFNRDTATMIFNEQVTVQPIERGPENSPYVAFACNVDWGNEVIPEMLQVLEEKNAKITFFVTGRWAKEFPDIFQTIVDAGHEIGSHGYQHIDYGTLSLEQNMNQIKKAQEVIVKQTNVKPTLFAPPSGAYNQNTLLAAQKLGYQTILWSIDTIDWRKGSTKDIILKRVLDKPSHSGAIVLMHPMPETAKALPALIDAMREKQLEVGRVSDVLKY